jgi:hypothetical protein
VRAQQGNRNRDGDEQQQAIAHGADHQQREDRRVQLVLGEHEIRENDDERKAAQGHSETKDHPLGLLALREGGDAPVAIDLQSDEAK